MHRDWDAVEQVGIDEIAVFKGHRYLTCVYQLDKCHRRFHKELILNWFRAGGELSSGPVEGLNNKAKLAIRKAYGFKCLQMALYHQLGNLNEPPSTHRFC